MLNVLKRNPLLLAVIVFAGFLIAAFWQFDDARKQAREDTCKAALDGALTLRDLIDFSLARNPSEEAQQIVQQFYQRIEVPPEICNGTGIDVVQFFDRGNRDPLTPPPGGAPGQQPPNTTPTTTIDTVPTRAVREPVAHAPVTPAPDRVDPPPGRPPNESTPSSTTTTSTTTPPDECTIAVEGRCFVNIPLGDIGVFPMILLLGI